MRIALTGKYGIGRYLLVDDEDAAFVVGLNWCVDAQGYPAATVNKRRIVLHRELMGRPSEPSLQVDHINRDKLDNRRANLRWVTPAQNVANSGVRRNSASGYKGVRKARKGGRWHAQIKYNGNLLFLGAFDTAEEAYEAYMFVHRHAYPAASHV